MAGKKKRHIVRNILLIFGSLLLAFILIGIFEPKQTNSQTKNSVQKPEEPIDPPNTSSVRSTYEPIDPSRTDLDPTKIYMDLASIDTGHIGDTKRYTYNMIIYQRFNKAELEQIVLNIYEQAKIKTPFNTLSIGFYDYPQFIGKGWRIGYVDFAPDGKIENALKIKTGDYSNMKMNDHLIEPHWEAAITGTEAEIIKTFSDLNRKLGENAQTGADLTAAEEAAKKETIKQYDITQEAFDEIMSRYHRRYQY